MPGEWRVGPGVSCSEGHKGVDGPGEECGKERMVSKKKPEWKKRDWGVSWRGHNVGCWQLFPEGPEGPGRPDSLCI